MRFDLIVGRKSKEKSSADASKAASDSAALGQSGTIRIVDASVNALMN